MDKQTKQTGKRINSWIYRHGCIASLWR